MILNRTPHPVHLVNIDGDLIRTFPTTDKIVRLETHTVASDSIIEDVEIPTVSTEFGECTGLDNYKEGVYYIVSQMVKSALPERMDLLVPAEVVRDDNGNIFGCRSFAK